jgi:murein L,D-transpeptidase YafK
MTKKRSFFVVFSFLLLSAPFVTLAQCSFKAEQLKIERVKNAYKLKEDTVKKYFADNKIKQPSFHLFIRAFKKEMKLETWVKEKGTDTFTLLRTYDFCTSSGRLGPKRKEGDLQIPEGVYSVSHFMPMSYYHLALGVSYPNASDLILSDKKSSGSAIYIHGKLRNHWCIPITDYKINELYILALKLVTTERIKYRYISSQPD